MGVSLCIIARSDQDDFSHDGQTAYCKELEIRLQKYFLLEPVNLNIRPWCDDVGDYDQFDVDIFDDLVLVIVGKGYIQIEPCYKYFQYFSKYRWARESSYAVLKAFGYADAWPCNEFMADNCEDSIEYMSSIDEWLEHKNWREITEFDSEIHVDEDGDSYLTQIYHDNYKDLKERDIRILKKTGMEVINGFILGCGWMLAKKDGELYILDRDGKKVFDSSIDGFNREDGIIKLWKGGHSWVYTYLGDLLLEADLPHEKLDKFTLSNIDVDGKRYVQILDSHGKERFRYDEAD